MFSFDNKTVATVRTRFRQKGREAAAVWLCSLTHGLSLITARTLVDSVVGCHAAPAARTPAAIPR